MSRNQIHIKTESGKFQIEDFQIYWERYGKGPRVILFIAGLLGDVKYSFHPVWEKLSPEKFTLIGLDLPGYGESRPLERNYFRPGQEFIFDRDARVAKILMENLGYEKFSIVGHSGGGCVAISLVSQFPEMVEKMVVCNTPVEIVSRDTQVFSMLSNMDNWPKDQQTHILSKYGRTYAENVVRSWRRYLDIEIPTQFNTNKIRARVANLKVPFLMVLGLKDSIVLPDGAYRLKERIPHIRISEVKYGEHSHLSFLSDFVRITERFLA